MLGHIFYFIGLFIMFISFFNLLNIFKYLKVKNWSETFKKVTSKYPNIGEFRNKEDYSIYVSYPLFSNLQFIWFLFGLISNSWYIFLIILVTNILILKLNNLLKISFIEKLTLFTFNFIKFIIILLLVMNHFHFHYNWLSLFR
jgi:hypothetical protein